MNTLKRSDPGLAGLLAAGAAFFAARALGIEVPGPEAFGLDTGLILLGAFGHCDTLDGPVVRLARRALETGNVNLVLPWVRAEDETAIRHAFERTLAVREGVRRHFHTAFHHRGFDVHDLRAEREFVEAYVRYAHYVEGIWDAATRPAGHHALHETHSILHAR